MKYKAIIKVDLNNGITGPEYFEDSASFDAMWGDGNDSGNTLYRWVCVELEVEEDA